MSSIIMAFPGGKRKALTFSYDDGPMDDARLIEILEKHDLRGTFNLTSLSLQRHNHSHLYIQSHQEVAAHTTEHGHLDQLSPAAAMWQVMKNKADLEQAFGRIVRGLAYPFGNEYTEQMADALVASGFAYARTTKATNSFSIPQDWIRMPVTCHHSHPELMQYADNFVNKQPKYLPWLFYVWGHSYEFSENNNWELIENFCAAVSQKKDVWYATNIEICDYVNAYNRLISDAEGRRIFNPSWMPVWVWHNKGSIEIAPGTEIVLP